MFTFLPGYTRFAGRPLIGLVEWLLITMNVPLNGLSYHGEIVWMIATVLVSEITLIHNGLVLAREEHLADDGPFIDERITAIAKAGGQWLTWFGTIRPGNRAVLVRSRRSPTCQPEISKETFSLPFNNHFNCLPHAAKRRAFSPGNPHLRFADLFDVVRHRRDCLRLRWRWPPMYAIMMRKRKRMPRKEAAEPGIGDRNWEHRSFVLSGGIQFQDHQNAKMQSESNITARLADIFVSACRNTCCIGDGDGDIFYCKIREELKAGRRERFLNTNIKSLGCVIQ